MQLEDSSKLNQPKLLLTPHHRAKCLVATVYARVRSYVRTCVNSLYCIAIFSYYTNQINHLPAMVVQGSLATLTDM